MPQPLEVDLPAARVDDLDGVRHAVERQPLDDARQADAVVAVEVGQDDVRDLGGGDAGVGHLPLRALAGVEEDAQLVPE